MYAPSAFLTLCGTLLVASSVAGASQPAAPASAVAERVWSSTATRTATSPPLMLMGPAAPTPKLKRGPLRRIPHRLRTRAPSDSALQSTPGQELAPPPELNLDGLGLLFNGPDGYFELDTSPPDPTGDASPEYYVQLANVGLVIFKKNQDGTVQAHKGPIPTNTLWRPLGEECAETNDGDGIVLYDALADRWFITQFSIRGTRYFQCVAVSTTADPSGSYHLYSFQYALFPDYGKFGVWLDAYYATFNLFNSRGFSSALACAYEREKMLQGGQLPRQLCHPLAPEHGSVLPADFDGAFLPPAGTPDYIISLGDPAAGSPSAHRLQAWAFQVDWSSPPPSSSLIPQEGGIEVAGFALPCQGTGAECIPQPRTETLLDSLGDRPMFRLAYRNRDGRESLVFNHTVEVASGGTRTGLRWYELTRAQERLTCSQQGTYAPDLQHRWMGSGAMDKAGNIALGYSVSSSETPPSIAYTGRKPGDAPDSLRAERILVAGSGSQLYQTRWGDYSTMSVDPGDDCTFWFTSEYLTYSSLFNWSTRIGTFRFDNCPPYYHSVSPRAASLPAGSSTTYMIVARNTLQGGERLDLSAAGLPLGVSATFSPPTLTAGGTVVMRLSASQDAPPVSLAPFNIIAASPSGRQAILANVSVLPPSSDFALTLTPSAVTLAAGEALGLEVRAEGRPGSQELIELNVSDLPGWLEGVLSPRGLRVGESATLRLTAAATAPGGTRTTFAVSGHTRSVGQRRATGSVTVLNDFSLALSPEQQRLSPRNTAEFQLLTEVVSGPAEEVSLSVAGLPPGVEYSLEPRRLLAGETSTLRLSRVEDELLEFTVTATTPSKAEARRGRVVSSWREPRTDQRRDLEGEPPRVSPASQEVAGCGCTLSGHSDQLLFMVVGAGLAAWSRRTRRC